MKKIKRNVMELENELRDQLDLLADSIQKVNNGNIKYAKTIASVLRILVIKTKTNTPLLFDLAEKK